jgi:hypothetical protein
MAWLAKEIGPSPTIVDVETGEPLAVCFVSMKEPKEFAWSRACIMSQAPDLHTALSELIVLAKRNVANEELLEEIKKCEKVLNRVKEIYDSRQAPQKF